MCGSGNCVNMWPVKSNEISTDMNDRLYAMSFELQELPLQLGHAEGKNGPCMWMPVQMYLEQEDAQSKEPLHEKSGDITSDGSVDLWTMGYMSNQ